MDENNRILDVTYGSFSCRLEGFDDSVETMKLVVSYFHDLAGHDRFMDMDPQAPDMETLARLTEDQTGQSVDIDMDDGQIRLRAQEHDILEDVAPEIDPVEAPEDVSPTEDVATEAPASDLQSNVADKLQRLRAVAAAGMVSPRSQEPEDFSEDLSEPEEAAAPASPLSQRLSDLVKRNIETHAEQALETEDDLAPEHEEITAEDIVAHAESPEIQEAAAEAEDDDFNVFGDDEEEASFEDDVAHEVMDETSAGAEEDSVEAAEETDAAATYDDADVEDLELAEEASENILDVAVEETDVAAADQDDADEAYTEHAEEMSEDILDVDADISASSDDVIAEVDEILGADELRPLDEENTDNAAPTDSAEAAEGDVPPLVLENETSVSETDDDHDDYNDDDEFDLEEEMAKVEAELSARKGDDIARHGLPRHVEDAMSRIMSQTDQHLNQPENRRHRDAFAQLKAAVAATEAARQLGDRGADQRDPDEAYKDDLGAHAAKDKSDARSTTPLKLVKSQEVKPPVSRSSARAAVSTPLDTYSDRLRQIATLKDAEPVEDKGGFADFASAHGATDLVDRLEAAGAYICLVEGEADFSRPQVMKVVQSATAEEISREDGLRSFGRLLRQARLVKLENGRFQIADNTQYRPLGGRAAQG